MPKQNLACPSVRRASTCLHRESAWASSVMLWLLLGSAGLPIGLRLMGQPWEGGQPGLRLNHTRMGLLMLGQATCDVGLVLQVCRLGCS
jgi:hypothetical protein